MKTRRFYIFLFIISQVAVAMPSLNNRCGEKRIRFNHPDNASLIAYDENCETAFIGPPSEGKISVTQVMGSTNLLFCETVKTLPKIVEATREGMKFWADRLKTASKNYDEVANTRNAYEEKIAELEPLFEKETQALEQLQHEIEEIVKTAKELRSNYDDCKLNTTDSAECDHIQQELKEVLRKLRSYRDKEDDLESTILDLKYKIKKENRKLQEINDRVKKIAEDLESYKRLLSGIENDALDGYQRYGQLYGATASVNFYADWPRLLKEAERLNRQSRLHIAQLPLVGTKIDITSAIPEGFSIKNMSTILGVRVPGFNINSDQKAEKIDLSREMSLNPVPWITTMAGQVDFNLIGACQMVNEKGEILLSKANDEMAGALTVNLQHTYPIMMKRAYQISFNTNKIVSEMEKLVESGGFLSSSKIHELTKSNMNKDTFTVSFDDDGGHTSYTDEEKKLIVADAKYEILDKILKGMNAIPQFSKERPPLPRLERSSGARFIYNNMPCFGYAICYATGFIIGVADAIFGSTKSAAEFKNINSTNITHAYASRSPGYKITVATFSSRGR